jgi:hypothetical protein
MPGIPLELARQLAKLPKQKRLKLIEIRKAYPNTPIASLPDDIRQEVQDILQSIPASSQLEENVRSDPILRNLPPEKLQRLIEIRREYPNISIEMLPENLKRETLEILNSTAGSTHPAEITREQVTRTPDNYSNLFSVIGRDIKTNKDVRVSQLNRRQALHIIGSTGVGKSVLLSNLILTDIWQGLGLCLIEPHGDLTNTVLAGIPGSRLNDVILLDIMDKNPFGLNLFQCDSPNNVTEVAKVANFVMHVFEKTWDIGTQTPHLTQVLRNVTQTLIESPSSGIPCTFSEIPLLLWEDTVREKLTARLKNNQTKMFWEQYNRKTQRSRDDYISSLINKVDAYLNNPLIANILSQKKTTINFRHIMNNEKILLIKLSPQLEEISRLIGSIIIGKLLMASFSRVDIPENRRRQFNIYCDEFQRFATSDFKSHIEEARKWAVSITISHQSLSQLDEDNRGAVQTCANKIVFRVSGDDSRTLARNFDTTPKSEIVGEEPLRAPVGNVIEYLIKRGHSDPRVTRFAQTYLLHLENFIRNIRERSQYLIIYSPRILMENSDILKGKELINETLYRCMVDKSADFIIDTLALFTLALSQRDDSHECFYPYIKISWAIISIEYDFKCFKKEAEILTSPWFIKDNTAAEFIDTRRRKNKPKAEKLVALIRELRYTMDVLANDPIMIDTGRYTPRYQQRLYSDMEGEIANRLSGQPNYQANAKTLTGEHIIRTKPLPPGLSTEQLNARIRRIKTQMLELRYCLDHSKVEAEIRSRQERLRLEAGSEPPPSSTSGNNPPHEGGTPMDTDEPPPTRS